jgi:Sec1 family
MEYPFAGPVLSAKERPQVCSCGRVIGPDSVLTMSHSQDIIIFIVGGATYEEARAVAQLNEANKMQKVYLTGSAMLNSTSFIGDLHAATKAAR